MAVRLLPCRIYRQGLMNLAFYLPHNYSICLESRIIPASVPLPPTPLRHSHNKVVTWPIVEQELADL